MNDRAPPYDYRAEVTDRVIALMEAGTAPWQQTWDNRPLRVPMNPTTGKYYRGGNVFGLLIEALERGYDDNRWCTYKQASERGWQVRKGEKGSRIEFWEVKPARDDSESSEDQASRPRLIHRTYTVFNGQQMDGIPPIAFEPRKPFEIIEAGERLLAESGADIRLGGSRAFYRPSEDVIQLPVKEAFIDASAYYATATHELGHWTGHPTRLDRQFGKFGDPLYAKEEIRADMASLYLCAETGIPFRPEQQAAYINHWIAVLKSDKNEFFRAASDAAAITDYLLCRQKQRAEPSHVERLAESRQAMVHSR